MQSTRLVFGFDFGTKRIGVAMGNTLTGGAKPLTTIAAETREKKWQGISDLVGEWHPEVFVVGVPRHPDGTAHAVTAQAVRFARQLEGRFALAVYVVDERYSSAVIDAKPGYGVTIDDQSAAVILQQWFDEGCPERTPEMEKDV